MRLSNLILVLTIACMLYTCSKNPANSSKTLVKATLGGTVTTEDSISLIVPPGALQQDTELNVASLQGDSFDEFGIIGARLEPDGLTFGIPATIRFPLPADWPGDELPFIYEAAGGDAENFLITGTLGDVVGSPGAYFCEVLVHHFSSLGAARNCHAGTINFLLDDFEAKGCGVDEMTTQVKALHGDRFSIQIYKGKTDEFTVANIPLQSFLDTYFDNVRGYEAWEPVTEDMIDVLIGYLILDRKQVVVAFDRRWEDSDKDGFYEGLAHSAVLEIVDGQIKLRQSVSVNDKIIDRLVQQNGENAFWYPSDGPLTAAKLNEFRGMKSGVGLEMEICGSPGCLWPNSPVVNRVVPYTSVRFYVSRYSGTQNPCSDGCTAEPVPGSPEESIFDARFPQ